MKLRHLSPAQWVSRLLRRGSSTAEVKPAEAVPPEDVPRELTAQGVQSRLAAQGIELLSTLRVLWVRPSQVEGEWEIFHPFSKGPLSIYEDQILAAEVAIEVLGREGGGSIALLDADGDPLNEAWVPPLEAEDAPLA